MDTLSYQLLFLILCIGVGVYLNRKNFGSIERTVNGRMVPSYAIAIISSLVIGIVLWIIIQYILLQF